MTNLKVSQDVSLRVEQGSPLQGIGVLPQVGFIMLFAGDTAPDGWIFCEGGFFLSSDYPELSDAFGIQNITPYSSDIDYVQGIIYAGGSSPFQGKSLAFEVLDGSGFNQGDYVSVTGSSLTDLNTEVAFVLSKNFNSITLYYFRNVSLPGGFATPGGVVTKVKAGSIPDLKGRYLVGTTNPSLIETSIGSNTHTHPFSYSASVNSTGTPAHNSAAVASNWGNVSTAHNHGWSYSFGTQTNSNGFSNVPVNVTAGNQANVWNSTHGHSFGGGISYNAATVNHSHAGNMGETTTTGNSHSHSLTTYSVINTEPASSLPSTAYLKYIMKVG